MKIYKIFEGELLFIFGSAFLLKIFFQKIICKLNISKIVSPVLAAVSVDGLRHCLLSGYLFEIFAAHFTNRPLRGTTVPSYNNRYTF